MSCPCGSNKPLSECCGPYLERKAHPPTAEALMRSRYVAYVQEDVDYIIDTHDPSTRDAIDRDETVAWAASSDWLDLEIVETSAGGPDDKRGEVEFVARYEDERGRVHVHRERSEFRKHDSRWYFYDGNVRRHEPVVRGGPKVGRNDPCPCGSGTKYKKCHGRPGAPALDEAKS